MRTSRSISLALLLGALVAAPAMAQESSGAAGGQVLTSDALNAAVAAHESVADRQRSQLSEFLADPELRELARERGIDMARVESAAAGLTDAQLAEIAPRLAEPAAALQSRGGTITISVAAVIIILLLLILLT